MAARLRLTSRETGLPGRGKRRRAWNTRTKRRLVTAACDICPVVLLHTGGSQIRGGDMTERPCHLSRVASASAPPESTCRAEKTPTMAEKLDERPRYPAQLGNLFGGMGHPGRETHTCAKRADLAPLRESRIRFVPGGRFHPGATRTNGGEIIERRCCPGGAAFVISPPAPTSRADERNVGEEIGRSVTSTAALLRCSPADVAEQAEQNRRTHIMSEKPPLLRSCHCYSPSGDDHASGKKPSRTKNLHEAPVWRSRLGYFSGEVTMYAEKIPTTADKLDRAPRWRRGLGQLPGRVGRPAGKRANELETLEPSAGSGPWPVVFARLYFFILAARRSVVAI